MLSIKDVRDRNEQAKNAQAKAEGGLDRIKKELKEKFNCKCMADAKKLLKEYVKDEKEAKEEYEEAVNEFEKVWDEQLNEQ